MKSFAVILLGLIATSQVAVAQPLFGDYELPLPTATNLSNLGQPELEKAEALKHYERSGHIKVDDIRTKDDLLAWLQEQKLGSPPTILAVWESALILSDSTINGNGVTAEDLWFYLQNLNPLNEAAVIEAAKAFKAMAQARFGFLIDPHGRGRRPDHILPINGHPHLIYKEVTATLAGHFMKVKSLVIDPLARLARIEDARMDWTRWGVPASEAWVSIVNGTIPLSADTFTVAAIYHDRNLPHDLMGTVSVHSRGGVPTYTSDERQTYLNGAMTWNGRVLRAGKLLEIVESPATQDAKIAGLPHGSFGQFTLPATVSIQNQGKIWVKMENDAFAFDPNLEILEVDETAITLYNGMDGKDSLTLVHPSVNAHYKGGRLSATLDPKKSRRANTGYWCEYAKVFIYSNLVVANGDSICFSPGTDGENDWVVLKSREFFRIEEFHRYKLMNSLTNAITAIDSVLNSGMEFPFTAEQVVRHFLKAPGADLPTAIGSLELKLKDFERSGMIDRDAQGRIVGVDDRLRVYAQAGSKRSVTHDTLQIVCDRRHHGHVVFHYGKPEAEIHGASTFQINAKTSVTPDSLPMLLDKNRSLRFTGALRSGNIIFQSGKGDLPFEYDYLNRRIRFRGILLGLGELYDDGTANPQYQCNIQDGTGYIDVGYYNFPSLRRRQGRPSTLVLTEAGRVQFDSPKSKGAEYDSRRFFFSVDPTTITHLDKRNLSNLRLAGELHVEGFMAPIRDTLRVIGSAEGAVMGVRRKVSDLNLYDGRARVTSGDLIASHAHGLQVDGHIQIDASHIKGQSLLTAKGIDAPSAAFRLDGDDRERPSLAVGDGAIHYVLDSEELDVRNNSGDEIKVYADAALKCLGKLTVKTDAVHFHGELHWKDDMRVQTDDVTLGVKTVSGKVQLFTFLRGAADDMVCRNMTMTLDARSGDAKLSSNNDDVNVAFRQAGLRTSLGEVTVSQGQRQVIVTSINGRGDAATTTGLVFEPKQMRYDMGTGQVTCTGVKHIRVADAIITPHESQVEFAANGTALPLADAGIAIAGHHLIGAKVSIRDSASYEAAGNYTYRHHQGTTTDLRMQLQGIEGRSYGTVRIDSAEHFMISRQVEFSGQAHLVPEQALLQFQGLAVLHSNCPAVNGKTIPVETHAAADSISLKLPQDMARQSGLYLNQATGQLTVAALRPARSMERILVQGGALLSENAQGLAITGGEAGAVLRVDETGKRQEMTVPRMVLPLPDGMPIQIHASGDWKGDFTGTQSEAILDLEVHIEALPDAAWRAYAKAISEYPGEATAADHLPLSYSRTLILRGVKLHWDPKSSSYIACGAADLAGAHNAKIGQRVDVSLQWTSGSMHQGKESVQMAISPWSDADPETAPVIWLESRGEVTALFSNVTAVTNGLEGKHTMIAPMAEGEARYAQWKSDFDQKHRW